MRFRYSLKAYFLTCAVIAIAFAYAARYYLSNDYRPIAPLGMWQGKFKTPDPLNKLPPTRIITTHGNWVKTWSILRSGGGGLMGRGGLHIRFPAAAAGQARISNRRRAMRQDPLGPSNSSAITLSILLAIGVAAP